MNRIIIADFNGRLEAFSSLKPFFKKYPIYIQYKASIETYLTRKREPYHHQDVKIIRLDIQK